MNIVELATAIAIAVIFIAALVVAMLNIREANFLQKLRPLLPADQDLPLYDALRYRAFYITFVGFWLLVITVLGAFGIVIANYFPPIRAFNALLLLILLAGPLQIGRALRQRLPGPQQARVDIEERKAEAAERTADATEKIADATIENGQ